MMRVSISDINLNTDSPTSRCYQGSFIQDDDDVDMQLILDLNVAPTSRVGSAWSGYRPTSVLTASWIASHAKWSPQQNAFDVDIAQLDFDNDNTSVIKVHNNRQQSPTIHAATLSPQHQWQQQQQQRSLDLSSVGSSLFSSSMADPALIIANAGINISTDSLDPFDADLLRAVCETNKNDYMLTFGDVPMDESGVVSVSPLAPSSTVVDQLTTWGRLRQSGEEPTNNITATDTDGKSCSLPNIVSLQLPPPTVGTTTSTSSSSSSGTRPKSLLEAFTERKCDEIIVPPATTTIDDYEYTEYYLGDGRYVDVNDNEIGFVPSNTDGVQRIVPPTDRWTSLVPNRLAPVKPPRTFAALLLQEQQRLTTVVDDDDDLSTGRQSMEQQHQFNNDHHHRSNNRYLSSAPPDLDFLRMQHKIPPLFPFAMPFPDAFLSALPRFDNVDLTAKKQQQHIISDGDNSFFSLLNAGKTTHDAVTELLLLNNKKKATAPADAIDTRSALNDILFRFANGTGSDTSSGQSSEQQLLPPRFTSVANVPKSETNDAITSAPDSGFGSSGPSHIQDWQSLVTLLPPPVVQACSFFKANNQLLANIGGTSTCTHHHPPSRRYHRRNTNSIERPAYRHRSEPRHIRHIWQQQRHCRFGGTITTESPPHCCGGGVARIAESMPCHAEYCHAIQNCCIHGSTNSAPCNLTRWHPSPCLEVSTSEDSDCCSEGVADGKVAAAAMSSEYQLRDRHVQQRHFHSMQYDNGHAGAAMVKPCCTCFGLRSPTSPPVWAHPPSARHVLCDCSTTDIVEKQDLARRRWRSSDMHQMVRKAIALSKSVVDSFASLNSTTASVQDAIVNDIWLLIDNQLCPALHSIIVDGLRSHASIWNFIQTSTALGPATKSVHELVIELSSSTNNNNNYLLQPDSTTMTVRVCDFLRGLLRLRSLDCWLSYVVLKDNLLETYYDESAFLLRATTAYRSQFAALTCALESLSLLPFSQLSPLAARPTPVITIASTGDFQPTRLASDSRVPKSSSVPARLSVDVNKSIVADQQQQPHRRNRSSRPPLSRIPIIECRPPRSSSAASTPDERRRNQLPLFVAIEDVVPAKSGMLDVHRGERLQMQQTVGDYMRCRRVDQQPNRIQQGMVHRSKLSLVTFV